MPSPSAMNHRREIGIEAKELRFKGNKLIQLEGGFKEFAQSPDIELSGGFVREYNLLKVVTLLNLCVFVNAWGHARLVGETLPPRSASDNLKVGPCGNVSAQSPTDLTAGQELKINWEETINHPGWYEFRFSPDGIDFSNLLLKVTDIQNSTADLPHKYQGTLSIPNTSCEKCIIQFIQVMTDSTPARNYYSCADINIKAKIVPETTPTQAPTSAATTLPPKSNTMEKISVPSDFKVKWREGK